MSRNRNTKCYASDLLRTHIEKGNPQYSVSFAEESYRHMLMIADRIQCVRRVIWDGLPSAFDSATIESMLYSYGAICCFKDGEDLIFSPFSTNGCLTKNGELYEIQPITLDGKTYKSKRRCYKPNLSFDFDEDVAIIIQDYTGAFNGSKIIAREVINKFTTIDDEVKVYRQLLYNIVMYIRKLVVTGVSEEQAKVYIEQAKSFLDPDMPIIAISQKDLSDRINVTDLGAKIDIDSFTRAISFYNKIRRNFNGVPAPDTFEKKERMLTPELENVGKGADMVLYDCYMQRFVSCDYINTCFNYAISVRINDELSNKEKESERTDDI